MLFDDLKSLTALAESYRLLSVHICDFSHVKINTSISSTIQIVLFHQKKICEHITWNVMFMLKFMKMETLGPSWKRTQI